MEGEAGDEGDWSPGLNSLNLFFFQFHIHLKMYTIIVIYNVLHLSETNPLNL